MVRIALTGGIATGKTHVLAVFKAHGVETIDADELAHRVIARGTPAAAAVARRFGRDVLTAQGDVDRARLGAMVFNDPVARVDLESLIHPGVYRALDEWFAALSSKGAALGVAEIALLYETGHAGDFDRVIVAACDPEEQIRRIVRRNSMSEAAARQRLAAQMPIEEKVKRADFVIRTDGTLEDTTRQAEAVYGRLTSA